MANDTTITVIGNLTADPELRFTASGDAVASFTIASTPSTLDKATGQWKDGETTFWRCSLWRQAAENLSESLTKGARVVAVGNVVTRRFTDKSGAERSAVELDVTEVGASLRYATAKLAKQAKTPRAGSPADDPWAAASAYAAAVPF